MAMESEPEFKQIVGWVSSFDQKQTNSSEIGSRALKFEGMCQASRQLTGSGCRPKWVDDGNLRHGDG